MYQFPSSHTKGQTEISEWDHYLRYPKFKLLPKTTKTIEVEKGLVFLSQGVNESNFQI